MSVEENKVIFQVITDELFNHKNLGVLDEYLSSDYTNHTAPPGMPTDANGQKLLFKMYIEAFPDMRYTIDDLIAEGDKVVARHTVRATHAGELMGIPPSSKSVVFSGITIMRIVESQITDHWGITDMLSLWQQIGAAP